MRERIGMRLMGATFWDKYVSKGCFEWCRPWRVMEFVLILFDGFVGMKACDQQEWLARMI